VRGNESIESSFLATLEMTILWVISDYVSVRVTFSVISNAVRNLMRGNESIESSFLATLEMTWSYNEVSKLAADQRFQTLHTAFGHHFYP